MQINIATVTEKELDNLAKTSQLALGIFERSSYSALCKTADKEGWKWSFKFTPSRVDSQVGRIKLQSKTDEGNALIETGRIWVLHRKFPWLKKQPNAARDIVRLGNDGNQYRNTNIRDFVIANLRRVELANFIKSELENGKQDRILFTLINELADGNVVLTRGAAADRYLPHRKATIRELELNSVRAFFIKIDEILNGSAPDTVTTDQFVTTEEVDTQDSVEPTADVETVE